MSELAIPGVGVMLGSAGPCPECHHAGKVWKVGYPTQKAKKRLELLVKKLVLDEVREMKGVLDAASYDELYKSKSDNLKSYETWRPGWVAAVTDHANSHLFLWSLLSEHHPAATEADIKGLRDGAPEEVGAALAQVLPDFFHLLLADALASIPPEREDLRAQVRTKAEPFFAALRARLTPTATSSN